MDIVPEIGDVVHCSCYALPIEVISTNIGNSTFIGLLPDGDEVRQESFLFSQIKQVEAQSRRTHTISLDGIGSQINVNLTVREEAQFIMARAGELAASKSGFILGGVSAANTKQEDG